MDKLTLICEQFLLSDMFTKDSKLCAQIWVFLKEVDRLSIIKSYHNIPGSNNQCNFEIKVIRNSGGSRIYRRRGANLVREAPTPVVATFRKT